MATITSDTYLDDGTARSAGEAWTCNGGVLTVRTDTRWHANAPASMTGSLGSLTVSATLGGGYVLDGTKVRWLAYDTGSGNVPAIGTNITQGGVSGYLLGVWKDLVSAPTAVGAAMPASGFIKFREVSGTFSAGALTGIGASATGADVTGWIEVVHDQAADLTFRRMGLGFQVKGEWFELGLGNDTAGQTFQVPTNGGGNTTHVQGVYVETGNATNIFEWWPAITPALGWVNTRIATDARGKFVESVGNGVVRFGSDGTDNVGMPCPNGARVRIPNVIGRQCATGTRATNATSHTTVGSRPEMICTSAPTINIDKFMSNWYFNLSGLYACDIRNSCLESPLNILNCPSKVKVNNVCVGRTVAVASYSLSIQTNVNGGELKDITTYRHDAASSGYACYFNNCAGTENEPFKIENLKASSGISAARNASGYINYFNNCSYLEIKNLKQSNHGSYINASANIKVKNIDHTDRLVGSTDTTTGVYTTYVFLSKDVEVDGITFGLNGTISNVHPYAGVFLTYNNLGGIKLRNAGSYASPLPAGDSNNPAYVWASSGNEVGVSVQRCYLTASRTLPFTAPNTTKGMKVEHVYGTLTAAQTMIALDSVYRNCGSRNTTTGQAAVYGTHWYNCFDSATTGRIIVAYNEPTSESAKYASTNFGAGAGFTSAGSVSMPNIDDMVEFETPYFIIGYTALADANPTITGTNPANFTLQYAIDTGSGYGDYKDLTRGNLSGEVISPVTGFKLKIKATTKTANANNALIYIRLDTTTTAEAQSTNLYPLEEVNSSLTLTGLEEDTRIRVYNADYSELLDAKDLAETTYTYDYTWNSTDSDFDVNVLIWKDDKKIIRLEALSLTDKPQSIPISQQDDLVYTAPSNQVTIDFENKLLLLDEYATYVVPEIYSKWKDSLLDDFNAQYDLAFEAVGGQQISGSSYIPFYTFLINGWRVKPYESNQHITVNEGVLLTSEGDDPFVDTEGGYNIRVRYEQPVQAIALATSGVGPADVWSYANRSLSQAGVEAITNGLAKTTDLEGLNDVSKEEVRTEIDNALTTYDPPTKSELDTAEQNIKDKIDSKATGLTETEHDKLMSLKNANIIVGKKIL